MERHIETLLSLELPYRETATLRRTAYQGRGGPRVALVSGLYGDEFDGLYLCHRLAAAVEALQRAGRLRGTVELYPGINSLGLTTQRREVPVHSADLNHVFPGHSEGLLPQRVAAAVMQRLDGAALVVEVRTGDRYRNEAQQVWVNAHFAETLLPLARRMPVESIWCFEASAAAEATMACCLNRAGVPTLVLTQGTAARLSPEGVERAVCAVLTLWSELGVIEGAVDDAACTTAASVYQDADMITIPAAASGLFVARVQPGERVSEGQALGEIVAPHCGDVLVRLASPGTGRVLTLRGWPLVYSGSLVARVARDPGPRAGA